METNKKSSFWLGFFLGLAVVSVICFISLLVFVLAQGESVDLAQDAQAEQPVQPAGDVQAQPAPVLPLSDADHIKGNKDAKVVIIEYSEFECPFCSRHVLTMEQIEKEYGDKVAIVFRHFPLSFHANAQKAAEASECAAEQGKFWEMHHELFVLNEKGELGVDKFKEAAKKLGLNTNNFDDCLDSGKMAEEVAKDAIGGQQAGVSGTPGTFINGQLVSGAQPYEVFKGAIDQMLAQ